MVLSRRRLLGVVTAGAIGLAGCSSEANNSGGTAPETESPTRTATETSPPAETTRASHEEYFLYNWDRLEDADPSSADRIVMRETEYHPLVAEVSTGPLEFINEDIGRHTVTIPALEVDETVGGEERVTIYLEREGTFDYVCTLHAPDMLGRLVVTE